MSSYDERSEALKNTFKLGEAVGYVSARQDLIKILGRTSVSFDEHTV